MSYFPPRDPPLPLDQFTSRQARHRSEFNPSVIQRMVDKYAAGLQPRPTAEQLRNWMNQESEISEDYHPAIRDTIAKMDGWDYMMFRQHCGASIRGMVHLLHATAAFSDRMVHYVDKFSDIGDQRPRWDCGYAGIESQHRRW